MRKSLALIFVFIDVLSFSLILPLLPYYTGTFAATLTVVGLLLDANAATQLVGAPIIGRLSDRYGLAFTVFQTVFSLFAQIRLGLDARATSCVFSYVGLRIVAIPGDGIGLLENPID